MQTNSFTVQIYFVAIFCYRFLQRFAVYLLLTEQGRSLPEYCASSLFITLMSFYVTCHCRRQWKFCQ